MGGRKVESLIDRLKVFVKQLGRGPLSGDVEVKLKVSFIRNSYFVRIRQKTSFLFVCVRRQSISVFVCLFFHRRFAALQLSLHSRKFVYAENIGIFLLS